MPSPTSSQIRDSLREFAQKRSDVLGLSAIDGSTSNAFSEESALKQLVERYQLQSAGGDVQWDLVGKAIDHAAAEMEDPAVVSGRISMDYGEAGAELQLRLRARDFGSDKVVDLQDAVTDESGFFKFSRELKPGRKHEIVATGAGGLEHVFALPSRGGGDVMGPAAALVAPRELLPPASEFARIWSSLEAERGAGIDLSAAVEDPARPKEGDLALLSAETGWDVRLLALAAGAADSAKHNDLRPEAAYALGRMGLNIDFNSLGLYGPAVIKTALEQANAAGIVNLSTTDINATVELQNALAQTRLSALEIGPEGGTVASLVKMAAKDQQDTNRFLEALFEYSTRKDTESLWDIAKSKSVAPETLKRLRWQEPLSRITAGNGTLMSALLDGIDTEKGLSQLASDYGLADPDAWRQRLKKLSGGDESKLAELLPKGFESDGIESLLEWFPVAAAGRVRRMFPVESLMFRVESDASSLDIDPGQRTEILSALKDGAVKLGSRGIAEVSDRLSDKPGKLLQRMHSLYQVTPDDETFVQVWGQGGVDSSLDIARFERSEWLQRYKELIQKQPHMEDRLVATYEKSQQVAQTLTSFYGVVKTSLAMPSTPVLRGSAAAAPVAAKLPTLGSMVGDLPACEHCQSVLSPSAYYVDILRLLDRPQAEWDQFLARYRRDHGSPYPFKKPFDELDERRPDLAGLALTCSNTHTALPYIDIVNEILESLVLESGDSGPGVVGYDETRSSEELVAEPSRVRPAAYEKLAASRDATLLPYDAPWAWRRVVEPLLGIEHGELAEATGRSEAAWDRLGISPAELGLFIERPDHRWVEWYGLGAGQEKDLERAERVADALGLDPVELTDVVRSVFVNPGLQSLIVLRKLGVSAGEVYRWKADGPDRLDRAQAEEFEGRLRALDRRHASSGFKSKEAIEKVWKDGSLDEALILAERGTTGRFDRLELRRVDGKSIDRATWIRMAQFVRLMRRLDWTVEKADQWLCALYPGGASAIATDRNPHVSMKTSLILLDRARRIQAMLNVSDESFFVPALWSPIPTGGSDPLYAKLFLHDRPNAAFDHPTGAYLSAEAPLYEHVTDVQAALGMSEAAVRSVLSLEDAPRLSIANVSSLYRYGRLAAALGVDVDELSRWIEVLRLDPCRAVAPSELSSQSRLTLRFVRIVQWLRSMQVDAARVERWTRGHLDQGPEATRKAGAVVDTLRAEFHRVDFPADPMAMRLAWLLDATSLRESSLLGEVAQSLGDDLRKRPVQPEGEVSADSMSALSRLVRYTEVTSLLRLEAGEADLFFRSPGFFGDGIEGASANWIGLFEFAMERDLRRGTEASLLVLLKTADSARHESAAESRRIVHAALAAFAGRDTADIEPFVAGFPDAEKARLHTWSGIAASVRGLLLARRLGQRPQSLVRWSEISRGDLTFDRRFAAATEMRDVARSRYDRSSWLSAVRGGSDRLRQGRRDALLAYVLRDRNLEGAEALYERYLIDARMEPAVLTSRLRIAISAVQIFVQRCLLNLEERVKPAAIRSDEWEWMKRYRVWEANRKIFLYPENWLDPELRDDRSHLFRRLESRLLQTEVNTDEAEDAFFEYARDLETMARMDIVAMTCEQPAEDPGGNTLHVVARTHAAPRKYFHRRYMHGIWAPWEPIELEIKGDHVVAAFWKHRLHVLWLEFNETSSQNESPQSVTRDAGVTLPTTHRFQEVRLLWADCIRGEWRSHVAAGEPMVFERGGAEDVGTARHFLVDTSVGRDERGEDADLIVRVRKSVDQPGTAGAGAGGGGGSTKLFRVISHNAPVVIEDVPAGRAGAPVTALQGVSPDLNRHRASGKSLLTSFYLLEAEVRRENLTGVKVDTPNADKGAARLLDLPPEGMRVTTLDAPLRIDEPWNRRLAPFFVSDLSGSFYVEPLRSTRTVVDNEKWWDVDWKSVLGNTSVFPAVQPQFPKPRIPGPRPLPFVPPFLPPIVPPTPPWRDWVTNPETVIRFKGTDFGAIDTVGPR